MSGFDRSSPGWQEFSGAVVIPVADAVKSGRYTASTPNLALSATYAGSGYPWGYSYSSVGQGVLGDFFELAFYLPKTGIYSSKLYYANQGDGAKFDVSLDGVALGETWDNQGAVGNDVTMILANRVITAGNHVFRYTEQAPALNQGYIDSLNGWAIVSV